PVTFRELYIGELLWCGTKGFMFSFCVLFVISCFGLVQYPLALITPFFGFLNAVVFGIIGFFVCGLTKNINNFNLYFTGILTPMFFFSGTVFPITELPLFFQRIAWMFPMTHTVTLMRSCTTNNFHWGLLLHMGFLLLIAAPFAVFSYRRLKRRIIL
ncbi:MAG: ABC transporter permease, partial [bacterium]